MSSNEEEIWKDIIDYEGLYQISNYGNVYSCISNKILKPSCNTNGKYLGVILCKNGKKRRFQIHRLVATAFILNPYNYPIVNHKDGCDTNNYYTNLEWCTYEYNNNYGNHNIRLSESHIGKVAPNKGIPMSVETRYKMSQSHIGKSPSKETRQKISTSMIKYHKYKHG